MIRKNEKKVIDPFVEQEFYEEQKKITSLTEWISFDHAYKNLRDAAYAGPLPFNPKFNAVHWAFDVQMLCQEIAFSFCWMNSYAKFYEKQVKPGTEPSHVNFHVSYFADNCIIRIDSCRDKLALMVWAFYCPFNPEKKDEILDYQRIVERLKNPIKFGLRLKNQNYFLKYLETLKGADFNRVEKYRHFKIHRREPQIEIYEVRSHHDWSYMIPLIDKNDIKHWEKELKKTYQDSPLYERVKKGCYIDNVLFDRRKIKDRLWAFKEVQKHIKSCLIKLIKASDGCFRILRRRSPLNKRCRTKKVR